MKLPKHLNIPEAAEPFLKNILSLRAEWNESDLAKAVNLARAQADIEKITQEIADEGDIIENDRGTPIVNPKHNLMETLTRRELALSRAIHVHAEATMGRARDSLGAKAKKSQAAKKASEKFAPIQAPRLVKK